MSGKTLWNLGKEPDKLGNQKIRRSPDFSGLGARHVRQTSLESSYGTE
jgi:hypothetical protein